MSGAPPPWLDQPPIPLKNRCAGEPVSRVLFRSQFRYRPAPRWQPFIWAAGCPARSSDQPGSLGAKHPYPTRGRETPMRSCSGWGLPCECCCQHPGALLPHPFTLTCARHPVRGRRAIGGLLSVALSLAPISEHRRALPATLISWSPDFPRVPCETRGCPAPRHACARKHRCYRVNPRSRSSSSWNRIARHCPSTTPSIISGRQRRWNASTALRPSVMS